MADEPSHRGGEGAGPSGREAPGAQKSGPAAPPVIAVRMETLLAWVVERVVKFPREHKFTVGDRLVETCLDITSHLVEASYRRDKHAELSAARAHWFAPASFPAGARCPLRVGGTAPLLRKRER
jgi:hypothetical protein